MTDLVDPNEVDLDEFEEEEDEEDEEEEEEEDLNKVKIFTEESIVNLVNTVGDKCMMLAMYLGIPITTLVYMTHAAASQKLHKEHFNKNMLMYWVTLKAATSDRVKAKELVKALNACGLENIADTVMQTLAEKGMFKSQANLDMEEKERRQSEEEEDEEK